MDPGVVGQLRTKLQESIARTAIEKKKNAADKLAMATRFGLRLNYNPLFKLDLDLNR